MAPTDPLPVHGHVDAGVVREDLGRRFELMNLSYKPYPCCRDVHTAVTR